MDSAQASYTYRAGQKVHLAKRADEFVVRLLPEALAKAGIGDAQQLSSSSSRVSCRADELERLMSQARYLAPTYHSYKIVETGEDFLITDRILVSFREALNDAQLGEFAGRYGLILKEQYADKDFLFQLTHHTGINPIKLVVQLMETDSAVSIADHDLNYRDMPYSLALPTDPSYKQHWHLHEQLWHYNFDKRASSKCEQAWQLLGHFGSEAIVIAVADDGCKLDHPDFDSPNKFAGWGYFKGTRLVTHRDIDAAPNQMYQTGADHGTACAGVVAAEIDASLTVGAAPGCRLLPIKWESDGGALFVSDSKLLNALNFLADKVDVMSNSWGKTPVGTWSTVVMRQITELAKTGGRRGKGIVFLWAAGNENCPLDHLAATEVPYTTGWELRLNGTWEWVGVRKTRFFRNNLIEIPGVMHIAAISSLAQRSHYSNYGKGVTLCAPSNNVHTYSRLPVRGLSVTAASGLQSLSNSNFGGTSSATPLVAGIIGLMLSANPDLSALETVSILKQTASKDLSFDGYGKTPTANYDLTPDWDVSPIAPYDRGDFQETDDPDGSWSPWFGHGRVDAAAAVAAALARVQETESEPATQHYESSVGRAIPDNQPAGVEDVIAIAHSVPLKAISVTVNITHSWIGDLKVQLSAPDKTAVTLHNRTGSSQKDLQTTYTVANLPALAALKNMSPQGDWQLLVQDLAARDTGELVSWALDFETGVNETTVEDAEGIEIPDFDSRGVVRSLSLPEGTTLQSLAVTVDITHPNVGDLRVTLTTPQGLPMTLHDQTGSGSDRLTRTWSTADTISLQSLVGKNGGGTWQLRVADLTSHNQGKLNRWGLSVKS
ncbi:MAG: S8 family serine peptidase [Leptolyngbya sp. SIO4C1]|nr:S8 family serine peptidase [Leptolyngbya sp. SIO4C1]